jgi:hypothetical protein
MAGRLTDGCEQGITFFLQPQPCRWGGIRRNDATELVFQRINNEATFDKTRVLIDLLQQQPGRSGVARKAVE